MLQRLDHATIKSTGVLLRLGCVKSLSIHNNYESCFLPLFAPSIAPIEKTVRCASAYSITQSI